LAKKFKDAGVFQSYISLILTRKLGNHLVANNIFQSYISLILTSNKFVLEGQEMREEIDFQSYISLILTSKATNLKLQVVATFNPTLVWF